MHIFRDAFLGANVVYFKGVCVQGVPAGVQVHECGVHVWCCARRRYPCVTVNADILKKSS